MPYSTLGRLTHLLDANSSTTILDHKLSYNTAHQITQIGDTGGTHSYGYDAVDRLTSASYPGADNENFQYDSVGNRTGSQNEYDPFNRLVASSRGSYGYDDNGNQVAGPFPLGQGNYVYDFENRLTLATQTWHGPFHHSYTNSVHYSYDALGRRIKRSSSQTNIITHVELTKFVYDGQDVVRDLNEDDSVAAEYLNGPGIDNKLRQTNGRGNYYFTADHLGSTRALTNDDGEVVEEIGYDSFGNSTGSSITRYTYTGREFDSDTHLYYYRARFYDPRIGRFISEDPFGLGPGPNPYEYAYDNPLRYIDPTGNQPWDWAVAGGGTLAGSGVAGGAIATGGAVVVGYGVVLYGAWHLGEWIAEQPWNPLTHPPLPRARAVPKCDDPPRVIPIPAPPPTSGTCPPCRTASGRTVTVGTIGYRPLDNTPGHGVQGPHHNLFVCHQAPLGTPKPCKCFWIKTFAAPPPPPPGAIPIEEFIP